jgi:hypothetical protein
MSESMSFFLHSACWQRLGRSCRSAGSFGSVSPFGSEVAAETKVLGAELFCRIFVRILLNSSSVIGIFYMYPVLRIKAVGEFQFFY